MENFIMIAVAFAFFTGLYWIVKKFIPSEEEKASLLKE